MEAPQPPATGTAARGYAGTRSPQHVYWAWNEVESQIYRRTLGKYTTIEQSAYSEQEFWKLVAPVLRYTIGLRYERVLKPADITELLANFTFNEFGDSSTDDEEFRHRIPPLRRETPRERTETYGNAKALHHATKFKTTPGYFLVPDPNRQLPPTQLKVVIKYGESAPHCWWLKLSPNEGARIARNYRALCPKDSIIKKRLSYVDTASSSIERLLRRFWNYKTYYIGTHPQKELERVYQRLKEFEEALWPVRVPILTGQLHTATEQQIDNVGVFLRVLALSDPYFRHHLKWLQESQSQVRRSWDPALDWMSG